MIQDLELLEQDYIQCKRAGSMFKCTLIPPNSAISGSVNHLVTPFTATEALLLDNEADQCLKSPHTHFNCRNGSTFLITISAPHVIRLSLR